MIVVIPLRIIVEYIPRKTLLVINYEKRLYFCIVKECLLSVLVNGERLVGIIEGSRFYF